MTSLSKSKKLNSSLKSSTPEKNTVRLDLCVESLTKGCVQSFIEFFTLAHRPPVCVDCLSNEMYVLNDDDASFVQQRLMEAEERRYRADYRATYEQYITLASYFEGHKDIDTAIHFHDVAVKMCSASGDRDLESHAYDTFGVLYERVGKLKEAIVMHEANLRVGEVVMNITMKQNAYKSLARVYLLYAKELEKSSEFTKAHETFSKALQCARASGDVEQEGIAYTALGNINVLLGDLSKALEYQKRFLMLSRQESHSRNETKASRHVATLHEQMGQVSDAVDALKQSVAIAEENEDVDALCDGYLKLGSLYLRQGDALKAIHYLRHLFQIETERRNMRGMEQSRSLLGIANAQHMLSDENASTCYVSMIHQDLTRVLQWKSSRSI